MFRGFSSITKEELLSKVTEKTLCYHYLGVTPPCLINSPLRIDKNPSLGLRLYNNKVYYKDFSNNDSGSIYDLLGHLWGCSYREVVERVVKDLALDSIESMQSCKITYHHTGKASTNTTSIQCRIREWRKHDIDYWASYGITLEWLKYADVYPISHYFISKNDNTYTFSADKYAYVYIEHKEGNTTMKVYQPFNKRFKWFSKHDRSVISLWTKIPEKGDKLVVCSSVKDALCLWCNVGIPAISVQGEGYPISNTAIEVLKKRYTNIYILFDNDETGLKDGVSLSDSTGFINIILPPFEGGKDVSDFYKLFGEKVFKEVLGGLFS